MRTLETHEDQPHQVRALAPMGHTSTETSPAFNDALQQRAEVADQIWALTGARLVEAVREGQDYSLIDLHARAAYEVTQETGIPEIPTVISPAGMIH